MISFKATIRKANDVYVITVPKLYVENQQIEQGKQYKVTFDEQKEGDTNGINGGSESE